MYLMDTENDKTVVILSNYPNYIRINTIRNSLIYNGYQHLAYLVSWYFTQRGR